MIVHDAKMRCRSSRNFREQHDEGLLREQTKIARIAKIIAGKYALEYWEISGHLLRNPWALSVISRFNIFMCQYICTLWASSPYEGVNKGRRSFSFRLLQNLKSQLSNFSFVSQLGSFQAAAKLSK